MLIASSICCKFTPSDSNLKISSICLVIFSLNSFVTKSAFITSNWSSIYDTFLIINSDILLSTLLSSASGDFGSGSDRDRDRDRSVICSGRFCFTTDGFSACARAAALAATVARSCADSFFSASSISARACSAGVATASGVAAALAATVARSCADCFFDDSFLGNAFSGTVDCGVTCDGAVLNGNCGYFWSYSAALAASSFFVFSSRAFCNSFFVNFCIIGGGALGWFCFTADGFSACARDAATFSRCCTTCFPGLGLCLLFLLAAAFGVGDTRGFDLLHVDCITFPSLEKNSQS